MWETPNNVRHHLVRNGITHTYTIWNHHGEPLQQASSSYQSRAESGERNLSGNDQVMGIINDYYPYASMNDDEEVGDDVPPTMGKEALDKYERLLKNAKQEVYPGCEEYSVLTAIVEFMQGKMKFRMSNRCYDYFIGIFARMLPKNNCLPKDYKSAQKVLNGLGLGYEKIHACVNNCILFYKENKDLDKCPICDEPRYKITPKKRKTKIPKKVLRYLPLTPRLQRLYMSTHTATDMRWHKEERVNDDVMRHPADGQAWKDFDRMYPEFAADARNVRLGLATDGFNPFGVLNQTHSTWPIVIVPYNLPPWKCMKKEFTMMSLLITEDPGKSIDVYLRPLVDELKNLWENGVRTFDKSTGKMFTLRAAVMWTIHDFPAYAMISGWSTKGYMACPVCKEDVTSDWHAGKVCYMGHRKWLSWDHEWRMNDTSFDGKTETRLRPRESSGDDILAKLNSLEFGPSGKSVTGPRPSSHHNWTHKSILFELPYWSKLKLRHNLDVMHIEKNVCDTLVGTILDIEGKSKDTIKARLDLERMGIRRPLWMKKVGGVLRKPHPFFTVKPEGKKQFFKFLSSVQFPDGYASNISRCVNVETNRFSGLKSHDCHVLIQRLLPVGIRSLLPSDVVNPIVKLSRFFAQLTARSLRVSDVKDCGAEIVHILCKFEQIFPPAFFTSMIHVMIHLADEALLGGPVNYRWMYPIERLLGELKKFVRNRAKPEGSIVEAWIAYESLTFCAMYLTDVETTFNRPQRNNDGGVRKEKLSVFAQTARPFGSSPRGESFSEQDMEVAHWFILNNCDEIGSLLDEHEQLISSSYPSHLHAEKHRALFPRWLRDHVLKLKEENSSSYTDELYNLAVGPFRAELYSGCHVNGVKFVDAQRDDKLLTQNSGVFVPGGGDSADIDFYGKLTSVVQVLYKDRCQVILFKCHWFDTNPNRNDSIKRDEGLVSVNTNTRWYDEDPYILATMAKQVFYLDDPKAGNGWKVVEKIHHRNIYDIPGEDNTEDDCVADQQLSSSIDLGLTTPLDTNVIQVPLQVAGMPEIEIPIDSITIDLGNLRHLDPHDLAQTDEDDESDEDDVSDKDDESENDESDVYCTSDSD